MSADARQADANDLADLAVYWPDLAEMADGVDVFRDKYGAPTGEDTDDGEEHKDRVDGNALA